MFANLAGADLYRADLSKAYFDGTNLEGADFRYAKNLDKAKWPKGYKLVRVKNIFGKTVYGPEYKEEDNG
ncbi:MAG: pentapeptide repeat-containing protein [Deltaproteobacteria bacterium]|nr:pentapeptide repeat-containing protein [Deltaproteobacteria bacterium]